jgi:hypothetical protein
MIRVKTQNYRVSVTLWFTKHTAHLAKRLYKKKLHTLGFHEYFTRNNFQVWPTVKILKEFAGRKSSIPQGSYSQKHAVSLHDLRPLQWCLWNWSILGYVAVPTFQRGLVSSIRGSNCGRARFSAPVQTGLGAHAAIYKWVPGLFPGVKRPECGVNHPPPPSAEVKEGVHLHHYSPSVTSWQVIG